MHTKETLMKLKKEDMADLFLELREKYFALKATKTVVVKPEDAEALKKVVSGTPVVKDTMTVECVTCKTNKRETKDKTMNVMFSIDMAEYKAARKAKVTEFFCSEHNKK